MAWLSWGSVLVLEWAKFGVDLLGLFEQGRRHLVTKLVVLEEDGVELRVVPQVPSEQDEALSGERLAQSHGGPVLGGARSAPGNEPTLVPEELRLDEFGGTRISPAAIRSHKG
jgi:hypothetical protein